MKVCLDESKRSEQLERYDVESDEMFVKYLDETVSGPIPYTTWNVKVYNDILLRQAKERNDSEKTKRLFADRRIEKIVDIVWKLLLTVGMLTSICTVIISPEIIKKLLYIILFLIFVCKLLLHIKAHKDYIDENKETWEELEKYDEFLTSQTDFEKYGITINDLDNYSLDEIIKNENDMNENAKVKKLV